MDILTKENYMETIRKEFERQKEENINIINQLNVIQRKYDFREFYDMTTRYNNALVNAIHYFDKRDINYYDKVSNERILMKVCEEYLKKLFNESQEEINKYIVSLNTISNQIVNDPKYILKNKLSKTKKKNTNEYRKKFKNIQNHVDNFYEIGNKITNFDPDKDLFEAIKNFLPELFAIFYKNAGLFEIDRNLRFEKAREQFRLEVFIIEQNLRKINKYDEIVALDELLDTIENEFKNSIIVLKY